MEHRLQLNTVRELPKEGEKVVVLKLTDIQLHSNARPSQSVGGVIERSIDHNKSGRIYFPLEKLNGPDVDQNTISVVTPMIMDDPTLMKTVQKYQAQGYRVLIQLPEGGLPIRFGNDTIEFMNSVKGKRILRKIDKNKA